MWRCVFPYISNSCSNDGWNNRWHPESQVCLLHIQTSSTKRRSWGENITFWCSRRRVTLPDVWLTAVRCAEFLYEMHQDWLVKKGLSAQHSCLKTQGFSGISRKMAARIRLIILLWNTRMSALNWKLNIKQVEWRSSLCHNIFPLKVVSIKPAFFAPPPPPPPPELSVYTEAQHVRNSTNYGWVFI